MDIGILVACIVAILVYGYVIAIPSLVAKSRNHPQQSAIDVTCVLALFFPILWIPALIWAFANTPPKAPETIPNLAKRPKPLPSLDPLAAVIEQEQLDKRLAATAAPDSDIDEILAGGNVAAPAAATVDAEQCGNCSRSIGKLETPHVWQGNVVCAQCHKILST